MAQQMLDYECAICGHLIGRAASNANEGWPPGKYICQRCYKEVEIECKLQEVKDEHKG